MTHRAIEPEPTEPDTEEAMSQAGPTDRRSRRERRAEEREFRDRPPRGRRPTRRPAWQSPTVMITIAAIVVAIGAIVVVGGLPSSGPDAPELIPPVRETARGVTADGEALGPTDAIVTLTVYSDFQCPICQALADGYLPRLVDEFVAPGQLRLVDRPIAILGRGLPDESVQAAVGASCAADQGKYWTYHDWLFANQDGENRGAFSADRLAAIADAAGLDRPAWDACVADAGRAQAIVASTSDAFGQGINSTPTLDLAGTRTPGLPRTYDELAAAVRAAIEARSTP